MAREDLIQIRGGDAATWTSVDPILGLHEPGLETDTRKFKFGDGVTVWSGLAYAGSTGSQTLGQVIGTGNTYIDGFNTWTWNANNLTFTNSDDDWGFDISGEEGLFFTDGSGTRTGKSYVTPNDIAVGNDTVRGVFQPSLLTAERTYQVPDATGTMAIEENVVSTITTSEPSGSDKVLNMVSLTQAEYDAGTPVATTFYIITDA